MGRPSKGPRENVFSRVPTELKSLIRGVSNATGTSESQWVSDTLAVALGRPDLVGELNQEVLKQTA